MKIYKLIKFIGRDNILNADEFFARYKENKLSEKNVCFTFDDSLRCQYDIALPVLEDLKIKSFFFVYSSMFSEKPDLLEIYRYFRMNFFNDIDDFYNQFFKNLDKDLSLFFKDKDKIIDDTKEKFSLYSINDIKFRLVRDMFLTGQEYKRTMFRMFDEKNFNHKKFYEILFLNWKHLKKIKTLKKSLLLQEHTLKQLLHLHHHHHKALCE